MGLVLIAKNEAHVIARAIQSGLDVGVDAVTVVLDDKTTDDTGPVAEKLGATIVVRPFPGSIAAARNEAIEIAGSRTDYLLMLDPDDTYEGSLPTHLLADLYTVWIHEDGSRRQRIQLFRSHAGVRYEGIRHERIVPPPEATQSIAASLIYRRIGGGAQDLRPRRDKFMDHVADLLPWVEAHPSDMHATFVLAQSYRDAGEVEEARQWYERRLDVADDDDDERFLSALEIAFLVEQHGVAPVESVLSAYLRTHELGPMRAEPLFHLACYLREKGALASAWHFARRASELPVPMAGTIVDVEVYEWKAKAEVAVEAWMLGDRATAMKLLFEIAHSHPEYKEWADEQLALVSTQEAPTNVVTPWFKSVALAQKMVEV